MPQKFSNQAKAALAGNVAVGDTALSVTASLADLFPIGTTGNWSTPADWFKAIIVDSTGVVEVIKVGTRASGSGAMNNILRAQDGTTAHAFTVGSAWVVHGPLASDFALPLIGQYPYLLAADGTDPKVEVSKTGAGAAAAMLHMNGGKLTVAQSDGAGNITNDSRFVLDQTNGTLTCADISITSDERLKDAWRGLGRYFIQKLADVKHGSYRRKGAARREVGVSAQSLATVLPQAVHVDDKGEISVSYGQAALVAAIELARDNTMLRARLVDLEARLRLLEAR